MNSPRSDRTAVCFVCLGNICRSPLAEGLFIHLARERGVLGRFDVDSCGTGGWHVGNPPDPRSIAVATKHGIELPSRARKFDRRRDPERFNLLLAMDRQNRDDLLDAGCAPEQVRLMRSFDPALANVSERELDVPDPYYGGNSGFDDVYEMLVAACGGLLDHFER